MHNFVHHNDLLHIQIDACMYAHCTRVSAPSAPLIAFFKQSCGLHWSPHPLVQYGNLVKRKNGEKKNSLSKLVVKFLWNITCSCYSSSDVIKYKLMISDKKESILYLNWSLVHQDKVRPLIPKSVARQYPFNLFWIAFHRFVIVNCSIFQILVLIW